MKILIIPELSTKEIAERKSKEIEQTLVKIMPTIPTVNIFSLAIFAPEVETSNTVIGSIAAGYLVLQALNVEYTTYIGYLHMDEYPSIDCIIYESPIAKAVFEERLVGSDVLPRAREIVICKDLSEVAHEVYKRTIIGNISA